MSPSVASALQPWPYQIGTTPEIEGERKMSDKLRRFQARARALARSGSFKGWGAITFELQFEEGFAEGFRWVYEASTQEELDSICREARTHLRAEFQPGRRGIATSSGHFLKSLGNFPKGN
jgi:hypothetical protein